MEIIMKARRDSIITHLVQILLSLLKTFITRHVEEARGDKGPTYVIINSKVSMYSIKGGCFLIFLLNFGQFEDIAPLLLLVLWYPRNPQHSYEMASLCVCYVHKTQ